MCICHKNVCVSQCTGITRRLNFVTDKQYGSYKNTKFIKHLNKIGLGLINLLLEENFKLRFLNVWSFGSLKFRKKMI